jgi:hypothetical protein
MTGSYWCCRADFGEHEPTCPNFKPVKVTLPEKCTGKTYLPPNWVTAPCGTDGHLCRKCKERG